MRLPRHWLVVNFILWGFLLNSLKLTAMNCWHRASQRTTGAGASMARVKSMDAESSDDSALSADKLDKRVVGASAASTDSSLSERSGASFSPVATAGAAPSAAASVPVTAGQIERQLRQLQQQVTHLEQQVSAAAAQHSHTVGSLGGHLQNLHEHLAAHHRERAALQQALEQLQATEAARDRLAVTTRDPLDSVETYRLRLSPTSRQQFGLLQQRWEARVRSTTAALTQAQAAVARLQAQLDAVRPHSSLRTAQGVRADRTSRILSPVSHAMAVAGHARSETERVGRRPELVIGRRARSVERWPERTTATDAGAGAPIELAGVDSGAARTTTMPRRDGSGGTATVAARQRAALFLTGAAMTVVIDALARSHGR